MLFSRFISIGIDFRYLSPENLTNGNETRKIIIFCPYFHPSSKLWFWCFHARYCPFEFEFPEAVCMYVCMYVLLIFILGPAPSRRICGHWSSMITDDGTWSHIRDIMHVIIINPYKWKMKCKARACVMQCKRAIHTIVEWKGSTRAGGISSWA